MNTEELREKGLLEWRVKWLNEALKAVAQDLARAAMSEYTPTAEELLNYAKWMFGADEAFKFEGEKLFEEMP